MNHFFLLALLLISAQAPAASTDFIIFGNAESEQQHLFRADRGEVIHGARRLLPLQPVSWQGGRMLFTLRIDPDKPNYFTLRLWGSDVNTNLLLLYVAGKQIGYRHLGDVDILDHGNEEPEYNGRFTYRTTPLPVELTRGQTQLVFEVRSTGRIWGYGKNFEQYQKPMTDPTREIYRAYTHTDSFFVPEDSGTEPPTPTVRQSPGPEVLDQLRQRVAGEITKLLESRRPLNQMQMQFLANAYHVKWTPAYRNPKVVGQIVKGTDALAAAFRQNARLAESEPSTPNSDWRGLGPCGDAIQLLSKPLEPFLTQSRRAAWSEMLVASRDYHLKHRRLYTNQCMITDVNTAAANRGVAALDPKQALPETAIDQLLYEAVGLEPWRGSTAVGDNYFQLTAKGLTRELGYVGYYGEVVPELATQIYDVTRPEPGVPGDARIKAQLEKILCARAPFRYSALDADGCRAMRIETVVGWRDNHYPGDVAYAQRPNRESSSLHAVATALNPSVIGYVQQMFADNQFFATLEKQMQDHGFSTTVGLLTVPDDYDLLKNQPASPSRLPMTAGQPDFVFSDEEDGVVAVKQGDETLYVSLYWRSYFGINNLARVHYITPRYSQTAVVRVETEFEPSGLTYTRPDWTNFGFGNGGLRYPGSFHTAHTGEKLPIAKIPAGTEFKPGQENVYAGKGSFYRLRYGPYLIGMNCTTDKTYRLDGKQEVPPRSTVVVRKEN
jgi:hypothetical protein